MEIDVYVIYCFSINNERCICIASACEIRRHGAFWRQPYHERNDVARRLAYNSNGMSYDTGQKRNNLKSLDATRKDEVRRLELSLICHKSTPSILDELHITDETK